MTRSWRRWPSSWPARGRRRTPRTRRPRFWPASSRPRPWPTPLPTTWRTSRPRWSASPASCAWPAPKRRCRIRSSPRRPAGRGPHRPRCGRQRRRCAARAQPRPAGRALATRFAATHARLLGERVASPGTARHTRDGLWVLERPIHRRLHGLALRRPAVRPRSTRSRSTRWPSRCGRSYAGRTGREPTRGRRQPPAATVQRRSPARHAACRRPRQRPGRPGGPAPRRASQHRAVPAASRLGRARDRSASTGGRAAILLESTAERD